MKKFGIALKVKAKHGIIYNYMRENNLTHDKMSELLGISKATFNKMLHFKWSPKHYQSMGIVDKLEKLFACTIDDLFPSELADKIANNKELGNMLQETQVIQKEIDIEYLPFDKLPEIGYNQDFDGFEIVDKVHNVLSHLSSREENIIRKRYGIGYKEHTLEEVGRSFGLDKERIRQIEITALRKLRVKAGGIRELVNA